MKIKELIDLLSKEDPDKNICIEIYDDTETKPRICEYSIDRIASHSYSRKDTLLLEISFDFFKNASYYTNEIPIPNMES